MLAAVRDCPELGTYLTSLADELREASIAAKERAEITGNGLVTDNCQTMIARCDEFIQELNRATPQARAPERDSLSEQEILAALPQYPPVRHLMSNLLSSVEMLASTSLMITAQNEPRLRGALRTVVAASRQIHDKLGLRY